MGIKLGLILIKLMILTSPKTAEEFLPQNCNRQAKVHQKQKHLSRFGPCLNFIEGRRLERSLLLKEHFQPTPTDVRLKRRKSTVGISSEKTYVAEPKSTKHTYSSKENADNLNKGGTKSPLQKCSPRVEETNLQNIPLDLFHRFSNFLSV